MHKDATYFVQKCPKCQFFAHLTHQPVEELTNLVASWPFAQWGLDLLGPFVKGVSGVTHLVVGVDYFTKWVEAWPLSSLTSKKLWHQVTVHLRLPPGVLVMAYRTTSRTATGETPYHLAFGTEAVIPVEIGVPSFRVTHFDKDEMDNCFGKTLIYLLKSEKKLGFELLKTGLTGFETRFGKLAPNWEGPYTVAEVPHPGAYVLQDAEGKRVPRVWNVNNLKKFYP
ncbi:hypothetical protein SLEP1_g24451 [Rubroshorea leprosula]|uniref:Uncharacterized protein n=1 Tax=Rubroshorea leprosula TaxID=152421 RepID=A0AAV5JFR6_9ROSI|nr:hypothetical protein SLEP1_g24451 [Rubroshorea leprosula]